MNGHIPSGTALGAEQINQSLDRLPIAALKQVHVHLDALMQHRMLHGDDPTEAPES